MTKEISFLEEETSSKLNELDLDTQAKIDRWAVVGWVFAALYLILAIFFFSTGKIFFGLWAIAVSILSGAGTIQLKKSNYDATYRCWGIAGFMGLPLGLVLRIGKFSIQGIFKKIEDKEFQQMMDKTK